MSNVRFALEQRADSNGITQDTLVKYHPDGKDEEWGTVSDFDRLFDTCTRRWGMGKWDLEKLLTCIRECEFD